MTAHGKHTADAKNNRRNVNTITSILRGIVFITMVSAIVLGILHTDGVDSDASRYFMSAFTCFVLLITTFIPSFMNERRIILLPAALQTALVIFTFFAMYLGEIFRFYDRFWWWDILLHASSAVMLGFVGFFLFYTLNGSRQLLFHLNQAAVALFAFCFAVSCGVLWEIVEFSGDMLLGMNMQKSRYISKAADESAPGAEYVTKGEYWDNNINAWGRVNDPGLIDTMEDLIVDTAGALAAVVIAYLLSRRGDESLLINGDAPPDRIA